MKHIYYWLASIVVIISIISCNNHNESPDEPYTPQTYAIQGKVEKGPFISGSEISIQPMNAKLQVFGDMYRTTITDDIGNFVLGSKEFAAPYAEFMANGYFFNEIKGDLSDGTLTLKALVDLQDNTTVNVNVLTHLKYTRVKNLITSGKHFSEANLQAQQELLSAFGLTAYGSKDVSSFSITAGTDESAALIALSSLLLMDRTEAAFTEYLSKLSADFGDDGCFTKDMQEKIAQDKKELVKQIADIKENIIDRYTNLGVEISVKDLVHFVDWDNDGVAGNEVLKENEKINIEKTAIEIPNEGGTFSIKIDSPITIYLEPQIETTTDNETPTESISPETMISLNLYEGYDDSLFIDQEISCESILKDNALSITVSALQSKIDKTRTITLYDYIGNIVGSIELTQKGNIIDIPITEAPLLGEGAKQIVASISSNLAAGLSKYNLIEQYYAYNTITNAVNTNVHPDNATISSAWSELYNANSLLLQLKKADQERLNVYEHYCNIIQALCYSNLIYGWGDVPYIGSYDHLQFIIYEGGKARDPFYKILQVLKDNLSTAIEHSPEKKNESLKDSNGFFFFSKDVARVLLANIYMYEGNYNDAQPLLETVISNGYYKLDASTDFKPSTTTEDNIDITESTEVIFALLNNTNAGTRGTTIMEAGVMPYITLSDVYLSLAECCYYLKDANTAKTYIQDVIDAKKLDVVPNMNMLIEIKDIRERILLHSGTYFAFLKRTGLAEKVCGIEYHQLLYPIPNQELQTNQFITQNDGY